MLLADEKIEIFPTIPEHEKRTDYESRAVLRLRQPSAGGVMNKRPNNVPPLESASSSPATAPFQLTIEPYLVQFTHSPRISDQPPRRNLNGGNSLCRTRQQSLVTT
jgi:hypothetical protein